MARINIEDAIFRDQRFFNLSIKLGCNYRALGMLVQAWCLAQKWYVKAEDRKIPLDEWRKQGFGDILFEVGLAQRDGTTVRVAGADDQFGWLLQRIQAGQKSAASRKKSHGTAQPTRTTVRDDSNDHRTEPNGSRTSYLLSPFSDLSSPSSDLKTQISEERGSVPSGHAPPDLLAIWNSNCSGLPIAKSLGKQRQAKWRARWNEHPDLEYWTDIVRRLAASSFCQGGNGRGWRADVDFLLKPETHIKAIEGKYDNRGSQPLNADLAQMVREGKI